MPREGVPAHDAKRPSQPSHLVVGRIIGAHGLEGWIRVAILTDFPERFGVLETVYLGEELVPAVVEGRQLHARRAVLKLEGVDQRAEAEKLRGLLIQVPVDEAVPLDQGEYYLYQIVGLEVWTKEGEYLGRVAEVLETGSNDVYVVREGGREILIPALSDVVLEVDLEENRMEVHLMEGLR